MPSVDGFQLFNSPHLLTISLIFLTAFILAFMARNKRLEHWKSTISGTLAILLLGNELIFILILIYLKLWSYQFGLPLQLCDCAILAVAYSLFKHHQLIWELAYFWGLGGTLQAILTPDIQAAFPSYIYFKFFITHGCIVIGVVYLAFGCGRQINFKSVWRVFLITNIYTFFVAIFNYIFKTNYLYLCHKPSQPSILDYLGPWPYYIAGLEVVLIFSLLFYYCPFFLIEKFRQLKTQ